MMRTADTRCLNERIEQMDPFGAIEHFGRTYEGDARVMVTEVMVELSNGGATLFRFGSIHHRACLASHWQNFF
jgi:hypothetical protein